MKIIHTADWHLGRTLHGVSLLREQAAVLDCFLDLVERETPDAVVIAGDLYDRAIPPTDAVNLLDSTLEALALRLRVPVLLIAGNHDSPERLAFGGRLLRQSGLHVAARVEMQAPVVTLEDVWGPVHFLLIPYASPAVVRDRLDCSAVDHQEAMEALIGAWLPQRNPQHRAIAVAHAYVAGCEGCESERELNIGGTSLVDATCFAQFQYTALGHLHGPQQAGGGRVRYSGSLMKYSFDEAAHCKGALVVELNRDGEVSTRFEPLSCPRDVRVMQGTLAQLLAAGAGDAQREDYLFARLEDDAALLDPMAKLRAVYPNILRVEIAERKRPSPTIPARRLEAQRSSLTIPELFQQFALEILGEELKPEEVGLLRQIAQSLLDAEQEQKPVETTAP